jgi:hypothetical protein
MGANQMQDGRKADARWRNNGIILERCTQFLNGARTYLTTVLSTALTLSVFLMSDTEECARDRQMVSTRPLARRAPQASASRKKFSDNAAVAAT